MTPNSSFGPFRTHVRRVKLADRERTCVRVDRVNEEGEWSTQMLVDAADLWWLIPALQNAQTDAVVNR